jgi:hypothetical protein
MHSQIYAYIHSYKYTYTHIQLYMYMLYSQLSSSLCVLHSLIYRNQEVASKTPHTDLIHVLVSWVCKNKIL